jgi:hypothetical protein
MMPIYRYTVHTIRIMEDPFDFKEREYDSDAESVCSDEDEEEIFNDWRCDISSFDKFEFRHYTLKDDGLASEYENNAAFASAILSGIGDNRYITAVRLLADIYDLDDEENIRWSQSIRFELENFMDLAELKEIIMEHLLNNTAPIWHRLTIDETSDKGYNKSVKYHRNYFDYCVQTPNKTRTQVTTVCGELEIHEGIFVKIITDHNINYRSNDCLIQCMNEFFNMRINPVEIRRKIWPNRDDDGMHKDLHTPRHIKTICKVYDTKLELSDILCQEKVKFNMEGKNTIKLVKVGKVVGIFDRIDPTVDKRNMTEEVVYYDLETRGPDQRIYAFTWRHKRGDLTMAHNNVDYVEQELVNKLLDTAQSCPDNEKHARIVVYAWNGSRFDNWILFKLLKTKLHKKLWVHDIIINSGNELLMFKLTTTKINGNTCTMIFKDPKKMFSMSIPEACKVFGLEEGKHDFNHDDVDESYMNGTFDEFIKNNRLKILDYVRQDGVILEKLTNCISELYKKEDIDISSTLTRSVASSISWQKTIEQHKILKDVTLSPYAEICGEKYNEIMDHAIGGRVQCIERGTFDNVCGIDVNSMYPYVCANREYPCGEIIELKDGETIPEGKLGLCYVNIKKQTSPNVVPYRPSKHKVYNWNYEGEFKKWLTSVDMEQLDEYKILKGFYWTKTTTKFYKAFMIDTYNARTQTEKSDPMNLHLKLKMNGVTGSVFQHSFREMIMVFTKEEFTENVKKYNELVKIIGCEPINKRQYIVTMKPIKFREDDPRIKIQREFCKGAITQKPWVLTMFTYAYARKILRDEWIKLQSKGCKILYCDTDSLFFTNPLTSDPSNTSLQCQSVKKREYTHKNKELGRWNIECWNDEGTFHGSKVYGIKKISKLRIKGVAYNSFVMQSDQKNKDLLYDQKLGIFLELARNGGKKPSYGDLVNLVKGIPLRTINFYMERSKNTGIEKKYVIKTIE